MTDNKPDVREIKKDNKCENCRHSMPTALYPKVLCFLGDKYKDKSDHCQKWQTRD